MTIHRISLALVAAAVIGGGLSAAAAEKTPGYNHKIPDSIMTPDSVETRLGTLTYFDGMPDKKPSICFMTISTSCAVRKPS